MGIWVAGMCRDKAGNIYLTDAENNGVICDESRRGNYTSGAG
ncbi:hypothetical protein PANT111_40137 [Pantoea brenneri]|uniref:SMP-30/Gluconolactonase/LRE-like region domain-containing protein n=1 Tax=Pantoea brenneri TaxID=472694 RepID=A0AAX3JAH0_9GAMM|nr:hypothetical protein PANT111_40137 [Pantoea brenneri]